MNQNTAKVNNLQLRSDRADLGEGNAADCAVAEAVVGVGKKNRHSFSRKLNAATVVRGVALVFVVLLESDV